MARARRASATNVAVLLFLAALTIAHLWPVVSPAEFASRIQTRDSALCVLIMSHIARVLCGRAGLWDIGIFHPLQDTLCLSEPMLTQGVLLAPVTWLFGPAAAHNAWLYVCWFASAAECGWQWQWAAASRCWWVFLLRPSPCFWAAPSASFPAFTGGGWRTF